MSSNNLQNAQSRGHEDMDNVEEMEGCGAFKVPSMLKNNFVYTFFSFSFLSYFNVVQVCKRV